MRYLLNQKVWLSQKCLPVFPWPLCLFHLPISPVFLSHLSLCQICPALHHAALVHVNSMLETIPVKTEVDRFIGIDYSLIDDPVVTPRGLDMHFRVCLWHVLYLIISHSGLTLTMSMLCLQGMFFDLSDPNDTLTNYAVDPLIREHERMVYLALSEFFFDSGMYSYYKQESSRWTSPMRRSQPPQPLDTLTPKTTAKFRNHYNTSNPPLTPCTPETHQNKQTKDYTWTLNWSCLSFTVCALSCFRCQKTWKCCWELPTLAPSWCWWVEIPGETITW